MCIYINISQYALGSHQCSRLGSNIAIGLFFKWNPMIKPFGCCSLRQGATEEKVLPKESPESPGTFRTDEYPWHHPSYTRIVKMYQQKIYLSHPELYPLAHWMMVR